MPTNILAAPALIGHGPESDESSDVFPRSLRSLQVDAGSSSAFLPPIPRAVAFSEAAQDSYLAGLLSKSDPSRKHPLRPKCVMSLRIRYILLPAPSSSFLRPTVTHNYCQRLRTTMTPKPCVWPVMPSSAFNRGCMLLLASSFVAQSRFLYQAMS